MNPDPLYIPGDEPEPVSRRRSGYLAAGCLIAYVVIVLLAAWRL